jgi:hypothetical protein
MKSTRFDSRFEICLLRKREAKEEETVKELTRESNPRAKRGKFSSQKHKLDDGDHQWHGSPRADDGVHRHILFFVFFTNGFSGGKKRFMRIFVGMARARKGTNASIEKNSYVEKHKKGTFSVVILQ